MKRNHIIATAIVIGISASAFKMVDDIITRLGTQHANAQDHILKNLAGDFSNEPVNSDITDGGEERIFKLPYMPKLSTVISADKVAAAKEMCAYVKQYINSNEFAAAYTKARETAKPESEPYRMDASTIATLKGNLKETEKSLAQMKAAKMPAATIQQMEKAIAEQKIMIAEQSDPTPNKTKWNKMYPEDPADAVKNKLQEYLSLAATVDFAAQLTEPDRYKIKKFVKPEYEKKSLKWKAIYRAGKEVNDAVTAFVKEWLKGEIIAKEKTSMAIYNNVKPASASENKGNNSQSNDAAPASKPEEKVKEKKSLFKKLKEKVGQ